MVEFKKHNIYKSSLTPYYLYILDIRKAFSHLKGGYAIQYRFYWLDIPDEEHDIFDFELEKDEWVEIDEISYG